MIALHGDLEPNTSQDERIVEKMYRIPSKRKTTADTCIKETRDVKLENIRFSLIKCTLEVTTPFLCLLCSLHPSSTANLSFKFL